MAEPDSKRICHQLDHEPREDKKRQADAHVKAFLKVAMDDSSSRNRAKKKKRKDVAIQTDSVELGVDEEEMRQWNSYALLQIHEGQENWISQLDQEKECVYQPTFQYDSEVNYLKDMQEQLCQSIEQDPETHKLSGAKVRKVMNKWIRQYEQWFFKHFGVDVKGLTDHHTEQNQQPQPPAQVELSPGPEMLTAESMALLSQNLMSVNTAATSQADSNCVSAQPLHYDSSALNPLLSPFVGSVMRPELLSQPGLPMTPVVPAFPQLSAFVDASQMLLAAQLQLQQQQQQAQQTLLADAMRAEEAQVSAMLAAALMSSQLPSRADAHQSPWGTPLRYGTYGKLGRNQTGVQYFSREKDFISSAVHAQASVTSTASMGTDTFAPGHLLVHRLPPPPPTLILLKKQSLICTLQGPISAKWQELRTRELRPDGKELPASMALLSSVQINYVDAFVRTVREAVRLEPVCVFQRVNRLPKREREFYLANRVAPCPSNSILFDADIVNAYQVAPFVRTTAPGVRLALQESGRACADLWVCDLFIGDVFIAQCLAEDREQARVCLARQAFRLLSQCEYLVGGVRTWTNCDYLSVCLSRGADWVPKLPPFLHDPLDVSVGGGEPLLPVDWTLDTMNVKPRDDCWLYTADLEPDLWTEASVERLLAQSSLFSQMRLSFQIEVDPLFCCFAAHALLDGQRCALAFATNAVAARAQSAANLFDGLRQTQPVVGLSSHLVNKGPHPNDAPSKCSKFALWGLDSDALFDSLIWADSTDTSSTISLPQLEQECQLGGMKLVAEGDLDALMQRIQCYATIPQVAPLVLPDSVVARSLWPALCEEADRWGLITAQRDFAGDRALLVAKRVPLPRLKRTLLKHGQAGVFRVINPGQLSEECRNRLSEYDTLHDHQEETPADTTSAFTEDQTSQAGATDAGADLADERSKPSSVASAQSSPDLKTIEIIDDLPKQLIPGIDF